MIIKYEINISEKIYVDDAGIKKTFLTLTYWLQSKTVSRTKND